MRKKKSITALLIAFTMTAAVPIVKAAEVKTKDYANETVQEAAAVQGLLEGLGIAEECKEMGFNANSEIVYINMLESIFDLAGYKNYADSLGGYPMNYFRLAVNADLTVGLENKDLYDTLSREEAQTLMYHALAMKTMETTLGASVKFSYGDTLLKEQYDTELFTGIMTANTKTSLYYDRGKSGSVEINGKTYSALSNYDEYLGYSLDFYVRNSDGEDIIIYAEPNRKNTIVSITSESIFEDTTKEIVRYEQSPGKERKLRINSGASYIYNDVYYTNTETGYITDADMCAANLRYIFIDNNNDGNYDVIKAEHYSYIFVDDVKVEEGKIYDRLTQKALLLNDDDILIYPDGDTVDISVITKDCVLGIKLPKGVGIDAFHDPIEIVYLDSTVTGTVTTANEDEVTINGTVYNVNREYMDVDIDAGRTYKFYVDVYGSLLSGESSMRGALDSYAYIKKAYLLESGDEGIIRVYSPETGVQDYKFSEKIRIQDPAFTYIEKGINGFLNKQNKMMNILVKLTVNEGEVTKVELPRKLNYGQTGTKDEFNYIPAQSYFNRKGVLDDLYYAPDDSTSYTVSRDNSVITGERTETFAKAYSGTNITADLYNIDSEYCVGMTLRRVNTEYSSSISSTENMFIVDRIKDAVNEETGDYTYIVKGYINGEEKEYMFTDEDMNSLSFDEGNANRRVLKINELERGDVLQLSVTNEGIIDGFRVLLDANKDKSYTKYLRGSANDAQAWEITSYRFSTDETYLGFGSVNERSTGSFKYHVTDSGNGNETDLVIFRERPSYVYIVDGNELETGTFADISVGDKVFVSYIYGVERDVVVYKESE